MNSGKSVAAAILVCVMLPLVEGQYSRGRRGGGTTTSSPVPLKGLVVTFHGALKKLNKKELLMQSDDNQLLTMRCTRKTKYLDADGEIKPSEIDLESRVAVDASEDNDLKLMALKVTVEGTRKKALGK